MWAVHTFREVGILVPGFAVRERNFWLFPMMYEPAMRRLLLEILWVKGVQGFIGSTQIEYVGDCEGFDPCPLGKGLLDSFVFMPIQPGVKDLDFRNIVLRIIEAHKHVGYVMNQRNIPKSPFIVRMEIESKNFAEQEEKRKASNINYQKEKASLARL